MAEPTHSSSSEHENQEQTKCEKYCVAASCFSVSIPCKCSTRWNFSVKFHWSILLLIPLLWFYLRGLHWTIVILQIFSILVFQIVSVLLHELGHVVAFVYIYNTKVEQVMLMALGGATLPEGLRMPTKKGSEAVIAVLGPLVNLVLAGIFYLADFLAFQKFTTDDLTLTQLYVHKFLVIIFMLNLLLAIFNMLPIYPLDGGKVFRSLMTLCCSLRTATTITAIIGIPCGGGVIAFGIYFHDYLTAIIGGVLILAVVLEWWRVRKEANEGSENATVKASRSDAVHSDSANEIALDIPQHKEEEQGLLASEEHVL